jgi:hypothetical protein
MAYTVGLSPYLMAIATGALVAYLILKDEWKNW